MALIPLNITQKAKFLFLFMYTLDRLGVDGSSMLNDVKHDDLVTFIDHHGK